MRTRGRANRGCANLRGQPGRRTEPPLPARFVGAGASGNLASMRTLRGELRDHFDAPRNVGRLPESTGVAAGVVGQGVAHNEACGDVLHFWVRVESQRVAAARFQAQACSAVIACGSLAASGVEGLSTSEARQLDVAAMARAAGGVPPGKSHAPRVVARALQQALDQAGAVRAPDVGARPGDSPRTDSPREGRSGPGDGDSCSAS